MEISGKAAKEKPPESLENSCSRTLKKQNEKEIRSGQDFCTVLYIFHPFHARFISDPLTSEPLKVLNLAKELVV